MNEIEKIQQWKIPKWHPDFGDPKLELDILKSLCSTIIENGYDYVFELDSFEEGYISIIAYKNKQLFFESQVIDIDENKIGLFFENGDEIYIYKSDEILRILEDHGN